MYLQMYFISVQKEISASVRSLQLIKTIYVVTHIKQHLTD